MNSYSPAKTANNNHFHKKGFESGSLWNSEMAYSRENKKIALHVIWILTCGAHELL